MGVGGLKKKWKPMANKVKRSYLISISLEMKCILLIPLLRWYGSTEMGTEVEDMIVLDFGPRLLG